MFGKPLDEYEMTLQQFVITGFNGTRLASIIYGVSRSKGEGLGYSERLNKTIKSYSLIHAQICLYFHFVPVTKKVVNQSKPITAESEVLKKSNPMILKSKVLKETKLDTSKSKVLKKIERKTTSYKVLKGLEPKARIHPRPQTLKSKVLNDPKSYYKDKAKNKRKLIKTKLKGPIRLWVPKSEIIFAADMQNGKNKATFWFPGQWLLTVIR